MKSFSSLMPVYGLYKKEKRGVPLLLASQKYAYNFVKTPYHCYNFVFIFIEAKRTLLSIIPFKIKQFRIQENYGI